ncbi:hypothetical protein [Clostridium algidicarnis]|uniref:hypothetical protein n=1 Tax=Clostridium algidicarnis TaxID=37659 RepID=UPI003FD80097
MATHKKIKKVTVHYPTKENEEEFQRRAAKSVAQVLFEMYPLYVIDKIIDNLENVEKSGI